MIFLTFLSRKINHSSLELYVSFSFLVLVANYEVFQAVNRSYIVDGKTEKLQIELFETEDDVEVAPKYIDDKGVIPWQGMHIQVDMGGQREGKKQVEIQWEFGDTEHHVFLIKRETGEKIPIIPAAGDVKFNMRKQVDSEERKQDLGAYCTCV